VTPPVEWLGLGDAARVLCVTRTRTPALVAALDRPGRELVWLEGAVGLAALAGHGRYDVALVIDHLEHVTARDGRLLLARLRDLHTHRVVAIVAPAQLAGWTHADWRALEFGADGEAGALRRYTYDIVAYNPPREWNTPTHWANPRNFDRFRW
jgi:hypothetical protein